MKKAILFLFSFACIAFVNAQSNKEDVDLIQAAYGKEKKAIVADFIKPVDPAKKTAFWSLYDQYETERKVLGQKRIQLLERYANSYSTLDEKTTDEIIRSTIDLQKDNDGLIAKYYGKIKEQTGVKEAAQFYQVESYFLSLIRMEILDNIPFIEKLEQSHTNK